MFRILDFKTNTPDDAVTTLLAENSIDVNKSDTWLIIYHPIILKEIASGNKLCTHLCRIQIHMFNHCAVTTHWGLELMGANHAVYITLIFKPSKRFASYRIKLMDNFIRQAEVHGHNAVATCHWRSECCRKHFSIFLKQMILPPYWLA